MEQLEQNYKTDIKDVYYDKDELKLHDEFMEKYVYPLDEWDFKSNNYKYEVFFLEYKKLPTKIKENLKEIYLESKVLYFKNKITNIVLYNTFNLDHNSFKGYVDGLQQIVWDDETNKFLEWQKTKS